MSRQRFKQIVTFVPPCRSSALMGFMELLDDRQLLLNLQRMPLAEPMSRESQLQAQARGGYELVLQGSRENQVALRGLVEVQSQMKHPEGRSHCCRLSVQPNPGKRVQDAAVSSGETAACGRAIAEGLRPKKPLSFVLLSAELKTDF